MAKVILIACYVFIWWLVRRDRAWRPLGSWTLLIPAAWIAVQGSRPISYWFGGTGGSEANPIDTLVFAFLIGAAIMVLVKQGFKWAKLAKRNKALVLIYVFFLCSAFWSEMPATSLKRLFKDFGSVLVGLVFLIQPNPAVAVRTVFTRVAYGLFPLSMVFIKFFPDIGRQATRAGENMATGVTTQKNSLGETVFVFGLIILWDLIETWREPNRRGKREQIAIRIGMLLLALWLLETCDSQTSLLCLMLGAGVYWAAGRFVKMRNGKVMLVACLTAAVSLAALDKAVGFSDMVIRALGRDPSLTGRTVIWQLVLEQKTDRMLGNGFYTFWSSDKGKAVGDAFKQINSAHNGYLELYLDGGIVANVLLVILLLAAGHRIIKRLFEGDPFGRLGLIFWVLAIIYNFSESSYFRLDVLWFTFLLLTIASPPTRKQIAASRRMAEMEAPPQVQ